MGKEYTPVPPSEHIIARRKWIAESRLVNRLLPLQVFDTRYGLRDAAEAASRGIGVDIFFAPHPGLRDSLDMGRIIGGSEILRAQPVLAPAAKHQYDKAYVRLLAQVFGVEIRPVITRRTMERQPGVYDRKQIMGYLGEFIGDMNRTLDAGGVVFETIYADRQVSLIPPEQRPVQIAVKKSFEQGVDDFGLLMVYLHAPQAGENIRGITLGQPYEAWVGEFVPAQEAVDRAGGVQHLDAWAYGQILELAREKECGGKE